MLDSLEKLGDSLAPIAAKMSSNKHLNAIKDGFINLMPLLIIGSLAIIINNVFLNWGAGSIWYGLGIHLDSEVAERIAYYNSIGVQVYQGSIALIAVMASFTIAYNYANSSGEDGLSAGSLSMGAFFAAQLWKEGVINPAHLGTGNILTAILIAFFSVHIYLFCKKKNLVFKMPDSVPPGVSKAFGALIPGTIVLFGMGILAFILDKNFGTELYNLVEVIIGNPLKQIGQEGPIIAYIYVTLSNFLYFFGIHGPNVLAFIEATVLTPASLLNTDILAGTATGDFAIFSKGMLDSFVFIGGGGATLGLVIALLIGSKKSENRTIAKVAIGPALFNINEPLVFGLPIVMNPILFIPFVIMPPLLLTTAWIQIVFYHKIGLLANVGATLIPWTSTVGIGGFLAYQSIAGIIIALTQLAIATIIYLPFVIAMNKAKDL